MTRVCLKRKLKEREAPPYRSRTVLQEVEYLLGRSSYSIGRAIGRSSYSRVLNTDTRNDNG